MRLRLFWRRVGGGPARSHRWLGAVSSQPPPASERFCLSFHTKARTHTCARRRSHTHGHASAILRRSAPARPGRSRNGRRARGPARRTTRLCAGRPHHTADPQMKVLFGRAQTASQDRPRHSLSSATPGERRRAGRCAALAAAVGPARCCCFQPRSRETHRSGVVVGWAGELSLRAVRVGALTTRRLLAGPNHSLAHPTASAAHTNTPLVFHIYRLKSGSVCACQVEQHSANAQPNQRPG